jgi:hypothetical protein
MDSRKIMFQRANAGGVLRAVPIRVLIHRAWAKTCREQPQQFLDNSAGQKLPGAPLLGE